MRTTIEITREEFLNLKDGREEGYSELDGRYFCRFRDKEFLQKQVDAIIAGKSENVVFLMEVSVSPALYRSAVEEKPSHYKPPEIKMTVRKATLVEEHAKEIKLSVTPEDFLRDKYIKSETGI